MRALAVSDVVRCLFVCLWWWLLLLLLLLFSFYLY